MQLIAESIILLGFCSVVAWGWSRHRRITKRILDVALLSIVAYYLFIILSLIYLVHYPPPITMIQCQREIESFIQGDYNDRRVVFRPLDKMPLHAKQLAIAAEDPNFYHHKGVDWGALIMKWRLSRRNGTKPVGASTITQQLVKNIFLVTYRSYMRKGVEFTITPLAELILSKDRILELYLNVVEWDDGVYGLEAAALHYYDIPAIQLDREQAARLIAVLPAPRIRSPHEQNLTSSRILRRMSMMQRWPDAPTH